MAILKLDKERGRLEAFRALDFHRTYLEKDLEDWIERTPEMLTDGEPALVIGRQVGTRWGTSIDLLAIDADGTAIVVELKRAPTPRDIIAQALEYAAAVSELGDDGLRRVAERYLASRRPPTRLDAAYAAAFGTASEEIGSEGPPTTTVPALNGRQRIIVAIEGPSERVISVARHLRDAGVDISVLVYRYYELDNGEPLLDVERVVGGSAVQEAVAGQPTEASVLAQYPPAAQRAASAFKDALVADDSVVLSPAKRSFSFFKQTSAGRVFLAQFSGDTPTAYVALRADSLAPWLDANNVLDEIQRLAGPDVKVGHRQTWPCLRFPFSEDLSRRVGELIRQHVAAAIE